MREKKFMKREKLKLYVRLKYNQPTTQANTNGKTPTELLS